jgi:L-asparagine permease
VVFTAAMSSLNAGLYSTGRILRSLAMNGSAPAFTAKMNRNGVPFGGIALTGAITLLGIGLNLVVPGEAFNIALDLSALGIIWTWGMIVACQIQLYRWEQKGLLTRPAFQLPLAPYTSYATLIFLVAVTALMCYENYWNLIAILVLVPLLSGGWYAVRGKVLAMAQTRIGHTGEYPVVPSPPLMSEFLERDNHNGDNNS